MSLEIRELVAEDFDNEDFIRPLLEMEVVGFKTVAELKIVFEKRKANTDTHIAIFDGVIVGVASLMIHHSFTGRNLAVPMDIYVSPEYRKCGIGQKLVNTVCVVPASKAWRVFGPVGHDLVPMYEKAGCVKKDVIYMEKVNCPVF